MQVSTIGLDLAKRVFQVHGIDADGSVVLRRRLRRSEVLRVFARLSPCLVGIEACGTAHHWGRELSRLGHQVRLLPPAYVKPYVKRGQKNDAADAAAICEAVGRPDMRFVPLKTVEQQAALMLHRTRSLLVGTRTRLVNALRSHLAEFGIVAPRGIGQVKALAALVADPDEARIPELARPALQALCMQLDQLAAQLRQVEAAILTEHRGNDASQRLASIPGIGPITASAIVASIGDASQFHSGRHFAAWLGLVPRQNSSGEAQRLGGISKMGDRYLRSLLVLGATARLRHPGKASAAETAWLDRLRDRRPARLVTVALANKMARVAWALLAHNERYRAA
jgi:transposase